MADAGIRGEAMVVTDGADDQTLARDMIEVHGGRLPLSRGRTLVWRRSRVRPRERTMDHGARVRPAAARWQRIANPGLFLSKAQKAPLKWRVTYTQRRSRVSLWARPKCDERGDVRRGLLLDRGDPNKTLVFEQIDPLNLISL